jgi:hypothetical protein
LQAFYYFISDGLILDNPRLARARLRRCGPVQLPGLRFQKAMYHIWKNISAQSDSVALVRRGILINGYAPKPAEWEVVDNV